MASACALRHPDFTRVCSWQSALPPPAMRSLFVLSIGGRQSGKETYCDEGLAILHGRVCSSNPAQVDAGRIQQGIDTHLHRGIFQRVQQRPIRTPKQIRQTQMTLHCKNCTAATVSIALLSETSKLFGWTSQPDRSKVSSACDSSKQTLRSITACRTIRASGAERRSVSKADLGTTRSLHARPQVASPVLGRCRKKSDCPRMAPGPYSNVLPNGTKQCQHRAVADTFPHSRLVQRNTVHK